MHDCGILVFCRCAAEDFSYVRGDAVSLDE